MKLDDNSQAQNPGIWQDVCGASCTRHTLTLKADMDQTVYLTAFTWNDRVIPDQCQNKDNGLYHGLKLSVFDTKFIWNFGEYEMEPFKMSANETVSIELEWNFSNEAHDKDWSITAFGDGSLGTLHLAHDQGLKTDSWNHIVRQDPQPVPEPVQVTTPVLPKVKPVSIKEPKAKPVIRKPDLPKDLDSEAAFIEWVNQQQIDGRDESSVLKEEHFDVSPNSWFFRVALKSKSPQPVTYAVAMSYKDWTSNMVHAYPDMLLDGCHVTAKDPEIIECLIRLTKDHPFTGWQLKPDSYGIQWAHKVETKQAQTTTKKQKDKPTQPELAKKGTTSKISTIKNAE